jgi:hypothetical protein
MATVAIRRVRDGHLLARVRHGVGSRSAVDRRHSKPVVVVVVVVDGSVECVNIPHVCAQAA